jgi:hypothetical protein
MKKFLLWFILIIAVMAIVLGGLAFAYTSYVSGHCPAYTPPLNDGPCLGKMVSGGFDKKGCPVPDWCEVKNTQSVVCSTDAKVCPDGSYVSRTGPNCEFKECPSAPTSTPNNVVYNLCQLDKNPEYEVHRCGNYYSAFDPSLMDAPETYYDLKGKVAGYCGGMPGPSGSDLHDKVCDQATVCSKENLCAPKN